MEHTPGPL